MFFFLGLDAVRTELGSQYNDCLTLLNTVERGVLHAKKQHSLEALTWTPEQVSFLVFNLHLAIVSFFFFELCDYLKSQIGQIFKFEYQKEFLVNRISGQDFVDISGQELKELGVQTLAERRTILKIREALVLDDLNDLP